MPRHLNVKRLSDEFGQYEILFTCARCRHRRMVKPGALSRIFGWDAELATIAKRMRCSRCNAKQCEVDVRGMTRPRDYRPVR
jgi:transcription elongation factor Elf1